MTSPLVVLTDSRAVTNRALSYAVALAVPLQTELVLLHARYDALLAPLDDIPYAAVSDQATDQALQRLAAAQPVPTQLEVSERELPEAVRAAVLRHNPLLLVLGQPGGPSTSSRGLWRSTAETLLGTVPYPLLLVPALGEAEALAPRRLLLAVDGQPFVLHQYQDVLRQLLGVAGGTLAVVRVADSSHTRLGAEAVLRTVAANNLTQELAPDHFSEVAAPTVAGGVLAEAARLHADLLVVVARRHSLLGRLFHRSITAQLIEQSPIPLLVLPAHD